MTNGRGNQLNSLMPKGDWRGAFSLLPHPEAPAHNGAMPREVMEPRCKNCRWWRRQANECGGGECRHSMVNCWGEEFPIDGVSIYDGTGGFYTGPDFGCVHFEPAMVEAEA